MLGLLGELERDTANALERVIKEEKARVRSGLGPYAAPSEAEALMVRGDEDNLGPTVRSINAFPSLYLIYVSSASILKYLFSYALMARVLIPLPLHPFS